MFIFREEHQKFLIKWLDIQLKKAEQLIKIGIGPDALLSAQLAMEVATNIETWLTSQAYDVPKMWFYLECEWLRARAGWLLDENHVHNAQYARLQEQRDMFQRLFLTQAIGDLLNEQYMNDLNLNDQDYEHYFNSLNIAKTILNVAVVLVNNPESSNFDDDPSWGHGLKIIKKHAQNPKGRYDQSGDTFQEIKQLHEKINQVLSHNNKEGIYRQISKDSESFAKEISQKCLKKKRLIGLLSQHQDTVWYEIGKVKPMFFRSVNHPNKDVCQQSLSWVIAAGILSAGAYFYSH